MLTQIARSDAAATLHPRRKTYGVNVGHVRVGGGAPIVVQSLGADYWTNFRGELERLAHVAIALETATPR